MNGEGFKGKYRIATSRLQGYDYGSNGAYFITVCTKDKMHYFGAIDEGVLQTAIVETQNFASLHSDINTSQHLIALTPIGKIVHQNWLSILDHFPFVILDQFIIMPNHLHGILIFDTNKDGPNPAHPVNDVPDYFAGLTGYKNKFGPQSKNLGSVLRGFKASVKGYSTTSTIEFAWQARFHDRIIRDEYEMSRVKKYIIDNPINWPKDKNNSAGIDM